MYRSSCQPKNQIIVLRKFTKPGIKQQVPNVPNTQVCFNSISSSSRKSSTVSVIGTSLLSLGVLGFGGSALYAKYNDEFRKNVEAKLPYSKTLFDSLYGSSPADVLSKSLPEDTVLKLNDSSFSHKQEKYQNEEVVHISDDNPVNTADTPATSTDTNVSDVRKEDLSTSASEKEILPEVNLQGNVKDTVNQAEEKKVSSESVLLKDDLDNLTNLASQAAVEVVLETYSQSLKDGLLKYNETEFEALSNLKEYAHKLAEAMFVSRENEAYDSLWQSISQLETSAVNFVNLLKEKSEQLQAEIIKTMKFVETINKEDVTSDFKNDILQINKAIATSEAKIQAANKEIQFFHEYNQVVLGASETLKDQLKQFTPHLLKLIEENKDIDILNSQFQDALLFYALKRAELERIQAIESNILASEKFIEMVSIERDAIIKKYEEKLISELHVIEEELKNNHQKKMEEVKQEYEREMHIQLKRQASAHSEHLLDQLSALENNLNTKHLEELEKKLTEQQNIFQMHLEKNLMYLNGIHSKINDVVNIEERQRQAQKLWIASQALDATLKEELVHGRTRNLMPELASLMEIGGNNQVLREIIATFPEDAVTLGVIPEKLLLERFKRVKSACKKVGMVNEGGSLIKYALSYFKSFFVISQWYQMNVEEPINVEKLDTYEILAKAEYFASQGDLLQTAKFISQLNGVSRKLSHDWLKETILLLETRQTVSLLSAYVASLCAEME
ncbi:MICOS complex subunit MIC60 isoform X1 [Hydra vulgaris]|uniref:MICOS complex subunit MIC60 isoform X1 n=1 Tax=Hydra vulgaris TaxID=6087 RepID=UPI001F5F8366|nr:MICOS complex subunit MIC60 isoform X1 [Hydra vulgaris]